MKKISNKFKFQLFGRKTDDLEQCYANSSNFDPKSTGFMNEFTFNQFLNSFGVFLTTQELRSIADHYQELNKGRMRVMQISTMWTSFSSFGRISVKRG